MSEHKGQVLGYARVSTADQNLERQLEAIGAVDELFTDEASGRSTQRPGLADLRRFARRGDVIRVKSVDRLARSTTDLLTMLEEFKAKGVKVVFLDNPELNLDTAQGEFVLTILGAVAKLERSMIRERQAEGVALAKARGAYRKAPVLDEENVAMIRGLAETGVPKAQIARRFEVSRVTVYSVINGTGPYAPKQ